MTMKLSEILSIVTCVNSTLILIVLTLGFLPQVKQLLAVVRDVVLWATLVVVIAATGWIAWCRFSNGPAPANPASAGSTGVVSSSWSPSATPSPTRPASLRGNP
jgi:hypothetical protein